MKETHMKRMIHGIAIGVLTVVLSASAFAQGTIRQRQENQQQRIGQGVGNGSLTAGETARLERQEAALNREIRRDRKDGGGLSRAERRKINRQQNRMSRKIYRQKHDAQHR
jgi:hypothetical protein